MVFHSLAFLVFFSLFFLAFWFVFNRNQRQQNLFLLLASYFFYGSWDWRFLALIVISSSVDFISGQKIYQAPAKNERRFWLGLSLVVNLGMLGFFKYFNFFVESFVDLFALFGIALQSRTLEIILPVGISFYTFQTLSYTLDIYQGKIKPTKNLLAFFAFVAFFPQLVAGPIERAANFLPQFERLKKFDYARVRDGLQQTLWGLFKKVVVADTSGELVTQALAEHDSLSGATLFLGAFFFALQLYADFSGYSDIAIGTGRMLGFNLSRNFNYPIFSRDIFDFWRRWHISLTSWLTDYVYKPFMKLLKSRAKAAIATGFVVTFLVSGLWHGANWTFVVWGLANGLLHLPFIYFSKWRWRHYPGANQKLVIGPGEFLRIFITFWINVFFLVIFVSPSIGFAFDYYRGILTQGIFPIPNAFELQTIWLIIFIGFEWFTRRYPQPLEILNQVPQRWVRWSIYYAMILLVFYFNYERTTYIYFQF